MTEPFFNEIRKRPEFQAELVVALEEEMAAMMKEMEAKDARIAELEEVMKKIMLTSNEQRICGIAANAYAPPCDEE